MYVCHCHHISFQRRGLLSADFFHHSQPTRNHTFLEGQEVQLDEPRGYELPPEGFDVDDAGYLAPKADGSDVEVIVAADSERLEVSQEVVPEVEDLTGGLVSSTTQEVSVHFGCGE